MRMLYSDTRVKISTTYCHKFPHFQLTYTHSYDSERIQVCEYMNYFQQRPTIAVIIVIHPHCRNSNSIYHLPIVTRHSNYLNWSNFHLLYALSKSSSLVAIFLSAGASGTPSAGLSYTILCLEAVGVPTRFIGLIFAVDWIV